MTVSQAHKITLKKIAGIILDQKKSTRYLALFSATLSQGVSNLTFWGIYFFKIKFFTSF